MNKLRVVCLSVLMASLQAVAQPDEKQFSQLRAVESDVVYLDTETKLRALQRLWLDPREFTLDEISPEAMNLCVLDVLENELYNNGLFGDIHISKEYDNNGDIFGEVSFKVLLDPFEMTYAYSSLAHHIAMDIIKLPHLLPAEAVKPLMESYIAGCRMAYPVEDAF